MKLAALQESWLNVSAVLCDEISMLVLVNLGLFVLCLVHPCMNIIEGLCSRLGGVKRCLGTLRDEWMRFDNSSSLMILHLHLVESLSWCVFLMS